METAPTKSAVINTTIARLKAGKGQAPASLTTAEQKLTGILGIDSAVQEKAIQSRKLNSYLQLFNSALKWFNSGKTLPTNLTSYIDKIDKADTKIDTKA